MKVAFATYPMAFHTPGGGEIQLLRYVDGLRRLGVDVDLFNQWNPNIESYDLIHFFSCMGGSTGFCQFISGLGVPLVVSSSLWITEENKSNYDIPQISAQLRSANLIITNSIREAQNLTGVLGVEPNKIRCVPNAVDDIFLQPHHCANADKSDAPYLLCVGNIEPRKNQKRLVSALEKIPGFDLVLVGHIRDYSYFDSLEISKNCRVRYLGPIASASPELLSLYLNCTAFVLPSLLETPGIAALEAVALGRPLVVTMEGPTYEYFGDYAYYVNPQSELDIQRGILSCLSNIDRPSPKVRVESWDDVSKTLMAAYEAMLLK